VTSIAHWESDFEDMDEARTACKHYNISVKERRIDTLEGVRKEEIVHWRRTPFKERKDPNKGTIIPLKPRKMIRTIESKSKGAPRLAVCRGVVSGEGSFSFSSTPSARPVESIQAAAAFHENADASLVQDQGWRNLDDTEKEATRIRLQKEVVERKEKQRDEERRELLLKEREEAQKRARLKEEKAKKERCLRMEEEAARRQAAKKKQKKRLKGSELSH
jgi:hypothetical protein